MKSPVMPKELPPLPVGKNGKPLVYLGMGRTFEKAGNDCRKDCGGFWSKENWWGDMTSDHYAAESNSEVCRANGWGDYEEPEAPATMLEVWRKAAQKALDESEARFAALSTAIAAEGVHMRECRDTRNALNEDATLPLERRAWYLAGWHDKASKKAKQRTTFPAMPD